MCAPRAADLGRRLGRLALVTAACALGACERHAPDAAPPAASADDATSARFAHPPPFEVASAGTGARAASTVAEVAKLEKQVDQLRSDVAALRAEVARGSGAARARRAPPPLAGASQMASAEAAFRGEAIDPDWSRAMADAVRATIAQVDRDHGPPRRVECRSQSCRIEFAAAGSAPTGAELVPVLERFAQTLPRATAGQVDASDGAKVTVVYLSR